jgi:hypothetical protein
MLYSRSAALAALAALAFATPASATLVFFGDLTNFNLATGAPPVSLDFDSIAPGTDLAGSNLGGLAFSSGAGNTLEVVDASTTFTAGGFVPPGGDTDNRLFATSGANVLSPGGAALVPGPDLGQEDSLTITFTRPISALGLDILFQSLDGVSFLSISATDTNGSAVTGNIGIPALPNGSDPASPSSAGGSTFVGIVSDVDLVSITFIDSDANNANPDSNIGYDSFRFFPAQVPEPSAILLLALGVAGLAAASRKAHRRQRLSSRGRFRQR